MNFFFCPEREKIVVTRTRYRARRQGGLFAANMKREDCRKDGERLQLHRSGYIGTLGVWLQLQGKRGYIYIPSITHDYFVFFCSIGFVSPWRTSSLMQNRTRYTCYVVVAACGRGRNGGFTSPSEYHLRIYMSCLRRWWIRGEKEKKKKKMGKFAPEAKILMSLLRACVQCALRLHVKWVCCVSTITKHMHMHVCHVLVSAWLVTSSPSLNHLRHAFWYPWFSFSSPLVSHPFSQPASPKQNRPPFHTDVSEKCYKRINPNCVVCVRLMRKFFNEALWRRWTGEITGWVCESEREKAESLLFVTPAAPPRSPWVICIKIRKKRRRKHE